MSEIRVCIQCLGCYNEGKLNFKWMDAEELRENLHDLNPCKKPHHEEYMMADAEDYTLIDEFGEYPDYARMLVIMDLIEGYGEPFKAWMKYRYTKDLDKDEIIETFENEFYGEYTEKEYAEEYLAGSYRLDDYPYMISSNINYDGVWLDLTHQGYWSLNTGSPNYRTYIFRNSD